MNTRQYQHLCRRAEREGYDGDIADLIYEDHERAQDQRRAERERGKAYDYEQEKVS
ncbi:hypothetical protein [Nakamurella lactea]|uniref:hypothetical protein n=1 Tax=Nakamurella lactea TaxID=459515 RepID=UPI0003F6035C|nr:hypothetical protein [Nakamurella lactea]